MASEGRTVALALASLLATLPGCKGSSGGGGAAGGSAGGAAATAAQGNEWTPCGAYDPEETGFPSGAPNNHRLLVATSADGLTWRKTGVVVTEHADVPDAVVEPDGRVVLYFVTFCHERRNTVQAAVSYDLATWTTKLVEIQGPAIAVDPDVVRLDDGRYRIYYTRTPQQGQGDWTSGSNSPRTYSAAGPDPFHFVEEGLAFVDAGLDMVLDPTVLRAAGVWRLYAGGLPDAVHVATSVDGRTFAEQPDLVLGEDRFANAIPVPGGYRFYGFAQAASGMSIISYFSTDGATWTKDAGERLRFDDPARESTYVKDPAVVRLPDGSYGMFYVTRIPGL